MLSFYSMFRTPANYCVAFIKTVPLITNNLAVKLAVSEIAQKVNQFIHGWSFSRWVEQKDRPIQQEGKSPKVEGWHWENLTFQGVVVGTELANPGGQESGLGMWLWESS